MYRHATLMPLALACALALAGCAGQPAAGVPSPQTVTAPPTATAAPTAAPAAATAVTDSPAVTPAAATAVTQPIPTATAVPPTATVAATVAPATATTAPTAAPSPAATAGEILFLRAGVLVALDDTSGAERTLADRVSSFAATPDGRLLALVRGEGPAAELWLIGRDGSGLRQLTSNDTVESALSWSPDGLSLAYTAAAGPAPRAPTWESWSAWCADAEVVVAAVGGGPEQAIGAGCEPAFSPDGRRIAFSTPPSAPAPGGAFQGAANGITIVNRMGANGWSVALADGAGAAQGYLVYGPGWAPDGARVSYERFIGYQALVDINLIEGSSSFERSGAPLGFGAGWLLAAAHSPDGARLAVVEHNFSDARGFGGYDIWSARVLQLGATEEIALPSETMTMQAATEASLDRVTAAAWAPDGAALAVVLPRGWAPGLSGQEPIFDGEEPGTIWRWRPGADPEAQLAEGVDFASPLLWLPPAPAVTQSEAGLALAVPAGWGLREGPADYTIADGPDGRLIATRLIAGAPPGGPELLFPELLTDARLDAPVSLPDGSTLHGATGTGPAGQTLAGALRISADGSAAALSLAPADSWPVERGRALALLVASGR